MKTPRILSTQNSFPSLGWRQAKKSSGLLEAWRRDSEDPAQRGGCFPAGAGASGTKRMNQTELGLRPLRRGCKSYGVPVPMNVV